MDKDAMGSPHLRSGASKGQAGGQPQPARWEADRAPCQMPETQLLGVRQRGRLGQPVEQAGEALTGRGAELGRWTLPERSQLSSTMAGVRRPYPDKDSPFTECRHHSTTRMESIVIVGLGYSSTVECSPPISGPAKSTTK